MDVSIIIVNYNTKELLRNCLVSIYTQTDDIKYEVIVSDNGSSDGSVEMVRIEFPQVILIENNANIGFGAANNKGLDIAKGKYVFYLNSDTVLLNNAIKIFYDFWEQYSKPDTLGAIGCNLINENYETVISSDKFPQIQKTILDLSILNIIIFLKTIVFIFRCQKLLPSNNKKIEPIFGEVDFVCGADLFMLNDKDYRYDEQFFLYYEETDIQFRLYKKGKKRILIDKALIQHLIGKSDKSSHFLKRYISFSKIQSYISCIRYFRKNYPDRKLKLNIIKLLTLFIFCNPFFLKNTYKYISIILSI
jgi:GT2 family glycosyltransferase